MDRALGEVVALGIAFHAAQSPLQNTLRIGCACSPAQDCTAPAGS